MGPRNLLISTQNENILKRFMSITLILQGFFFTRNNFEAKNMFLCHFKITTVKILILQQKYFKFQFLILFSVE